METGTIGAWHVSEGSAIEAGTVICEVETDKATVDFEAQDEGFIAKILVPAGSAEITVGVPVAVVVDDEEDVAAFANFTAADAAGEGDAAPAAPAAATPAPAAAAPTPAPAAPAAAPAAPAAAPAASAPATASGERLFASPLARKVARELGIQIEQVPGTGPYSRIIEADVRSFTPAAAAATATATPAPAAAAVADVAAAAAAATAAPSTLVAVGGGLYRDIPATPAVQGLAAQLTESRKEVPHYHLTVELSLDALLQTRAALNAAAGTGEEEEGVSVNDMLLKAAAAALVSVPEVNASWLGSTIRQYHYVDLAVLTAGTSPDGATQVTAQPVLRDAQAKGLAAIGKESRELAARAAAGELSEADSLGGTFTVANLGGYGVKQFTGIITPPQAALLSLGAAEKVVVPCDSDPRGYATSTVLSATLTCDHRVIDGAVGAQWLAAYRKLVENPLTLLL